jgi:hypothetical protein
MTGLLTLQLITKILIVQVCFALRPSMLLHRVADFMTGFDSFVERAKSRSNSV